MSGGGGVPPSKRDLVLAAVLIVAGIAAWAVVAEVTGDDNSPIGWVVGGAIGGAGFHYLIRWRRARDGAKRERGRG